MSLQIQLSSGTYIVAVSGGVDSVVLLDLLAKQSDARLIVAHFDHGIRHNSAKDAQFVRELARAYNIAYEEEKGNLGVGASEDLARVARYAFLDNLTHKYSAQGVVTAHHQDDVIETSILNLLRGTGRHGLTSLKSTDVRIRPLLHVPKNILIEYAQANKLTWRDDPSNNDDHYTRNKIRHHIVAKMTDEQRATWLKILDSAVNINQKLDQELSIALKRGLHKGRPVLRRSWFISLPHIIAKEALLAVLRQNNVKDIDRKTIERTTVLIKTLPGGKRIQLHGVDIELTKRSARFKNR